MKKKQYPAYVRIKKFVIPSNLVKHIEHLPEEDRKNYCFITSFIIRMTKKEPELPVEVHWKVWANFIGTNYPNYIKQLTTWNIIAVQKSYSHFENADPFCKSYKLSSESIASDFLLIDFTKNRIKPLKDKSQIVDNVSKFVFDNLNRIGILHDLLPESNLIDTVESECWAESVFFSRFNLHYADKVKRMYHTLIVMPSVSRKNLILKESHSTSLFEYDVKSCLPVILLTLCHDPIEKESYKLLLDTDFYSSIADFMGVFSNRDKIKKDFMLFINGGIKNLFYHYFLLTYPKLLSKIESKNKEMAAYYQNTEAAIMIKEIPLFLRNILNLKNPFISLGTPADLLYVPMHDGWLGIESSEDIISTYVRKCFFDLTGYNVTLTKKNLKTGEEVTLKK